MQVASLSFDEYFFSIIPTVLTITACIWLIVCYFRIPKKTIALSMVLILAISDLIFAVTVLSSTLFRSFIYERTYYLFFFTSMYFSIFWASGIAVLVYKSLKDKNFKPIRSFIYTITAVLLLATLFNYL